MQNPLYFCSEKQWWPDFSTPSATLLKSVCLKTQRWIPWTVMGDRFNLSSCRQTAQQQLCCGTRPKWGVKRSTCPIYFSPSSQGFTLNPRNQITQQSMNQQSPTSRPWRNQGTRAVILIAKCYIEVLNCRLGHLRKSIFNLADVSSVYHNSEIRPEPLLLLWKKEQAILIF